ncbi:ECF RNA polymerase sigma factor SigW [compost metagenome]
MSRKEYSRIVDKELAVLFRDGDEFAYTEIFDRYNHLLIKHAYQMLQDSSGAQDIVQDIFLKLWEKRSSFALESSISSYLYAAVKNRVLDHLAHEKVKIKYIDYIFYHADEGSNSTEELLDQKELSEIIEREVTALPPKMRAVFILSRQSQMSYQQIAEKLHITDKTAKLQVHKAIKILRKNIPFILIVVKVV